MTAEKTEKQQQNDFKQSLITYFKGVKAEWGKVSWPTKQQVICRNGHSSRSCCVFYNSCLFDGRNF